MIDPQKTIDFLLKEYSENYTHMRHYDNLSYSYIKYIFTFDLAVLSAGVTIYHYFKDSLATIIEPLGYLFLLGSIIGFFFLGQAVRNRSYYVPVTRQINRIRKYFIENMDIDLDMSEMYCDPAYPKYFNKVSTYSIGFYIISFLNSVLVSLGIPCIFINSLKPNWWAFGISLIIQILILVCYLQSKENKLKADEAIHGKKKP
jgi:hypothetical protein